MHLATFFDVLWAAAAAQGYGLACRSELLAAVASEYGALRAICFELCLVVSVCL